MGSSLYIVPEREITGFDTFVNGKALSAERKLSRIATDIGVTPLMDFFSQNVDDALAFIENEDGDVDGIDLPAETWFDAADGLATVNGLAKYLGDNPDAVRDAASVRSDLAEFKTVLTRLLQDKVRWHLAVDY